MDIVGKENLETLLSAYTGAVIVVSHDRYFVNKIADSLIVFEDDGVKYFRGTYSEYLSTRQEDETKAVESKTKKENSSYLENKERNRIKNKIERIENEIEKREVKISEIKEEMLKEENCTNYIKLSELQKTIEELENEISEKMTQWEELNNKI